MTRRPLALVPPDAVRRAAFRKPVPVGRMGIKRTEKRPGDFIWNGRKQAWEQVP